MIVLATRLSNGNLLVPITALAEGIIGDGVVEIGPDDPDFAEWDAWLKAQAAPPPTTPDAVVD